MHEIFKLSCTKQELLVRIMEQSIDVESNNYWKTLS